ncbi:MAG: hypothetical protein Q8M08_10175 [Bacteroidales bacterium]|nr:hypothetical protein [Bacteroidales bacterium]
MKTFGKTYLFLALFLGGVFTSDLSADPPSNPPPPPGGGHGAGSNQPPAGAPLDGGLGILFILGTAYAGIKIYKSKTGGNEQN